MNPPRRGGGSTQRRRRRHAREAAGTSPSAVIDVDPPAPQQPLLDPVRQGEDVVGDSENARFERASNSTRLFLCMGRGLQTKKTCALILVLVLLLVVEFSKLFLPSGSVVAQQLQASADQGLQLANRVLDYSAGAANLSERFRSATAHLLSNATVENA